ncbi:MAG: response regulator, partial [Pleurocapsa sp. MO_192.B19]|nr:response regulator [Pleurocapsa sp. MO_192.B19]
RRYEGTGLGLALVKNIVELHGGSVSVVSEVDRGSQFTVILPWKKLIKPNLESDNAISQVALSTRQDGTLILLAEDNEANILMMSDYLISQGYKLIFAHNGFAAIDMAKDKKPDLILMDIQMPDMDGLEATRRIRKEQQIADIPIIALTALTMPGDREKCLAAGVNEYMTKPVNLKKLVNNIEQQLIAKRNNSLITN